jgi:hypothetical protein
MPSLLFVRRIARRAIVPLLLIAPVLAVRALPAGAEVKAEPLPAGERGSCELKTFTPRQVVEMIYTNVVRTSQQTLDEMGKHVSPDIVFKDPVSSTRGWPAYRKVYEQFITADQLYYKISDWSCSGRTVYANWVFGMKNEHTGNQYVEFEGVSKLVLDENDRLVLNLDNWNEVPPGYAGALRSGDKGGVELP